MTQEELEGLLAKWQKILRLQDWDVKIAMKRERDMGLKEKAGMCTFTLASKTAFIEILDPVDYPESRWLQDIEETVVHELMHLHFAPIDDFEDLRAKLFEQALCSMDQAFVALDRKAKG